MAADGTIIINTTIDQNGIKSGLKDVRSMLSGNQKAVQSLKNSLNSLSVTAKKIGAVVATAFAVKNIVDFGNQCVELGSDLAEVQNVVDTVFPSMSAQVDKFAKSAASSFGLSETMAKKFTGTFGAIAKSFGFSEQAAYDMSSTLTGLAGDIASFYNISQDEAYTKLKSVFTGETESLKDLGVVMTQSALDAYAMANGFGKTTQAMSEAEKVALRYAFVQDKLSAASGDFAKTSGSWANQVRILRLQWESFMATVGQGLINLFTPVIKVINSLLGKLITLGNAFKAFTELITGKKITSSVPGQSDKGLSSLKGEYNDVASGADNVANSTGSATQAIEDQTDAVNNARRANKRYLSGLDEIKKFETEDSYSAPNFDIGNNAGLSEAITGSVIDFGEAIEVQDTVIEKTLQSSIDRIKKLIENENWAGLGDYVSKAINKGLAKIKQVISWENIGPNITDFIKKFTDAFNSISVRIDFNYLGRTLGTGINSVVKTLNLLIESINWKNLGAKFASGVNGIFTEIDWAGLGNFIGNKFMIAWNIFYGFVTNLNFKQIGTSIGRGINGAIAKMDFKTIGKGLSSFGKGLLDAFINAVKSIDWKKVGQQVADLLSSIDWAGLANRLFNAGIVLMKGLLSAFNQLPAPVKMAGAAIASFFAVLRGTGAITGAISSLTKLIGTGKDLIQNWKTLKDTATTVFSAMKNAISIGASGISNVARGLMTTVKNITSAFTPLHAVIALLVGSIAALILNWNRMSTFGRFVGVLGALAIAAGAVAVAMGALKSAVGAAITAGTIAAGIATVTAAVNTAKRNARTTSYSSYGSYSGMMYSGRMSVPQIPHLASGAVIPPRAEFLAVLGDQKHGNNIEAPEALIRKIVREESASKGSGSYRFTAQINRRTLFDEMISEAKIRQTVSGLNPFELA